MRRIIALAALAATGLTAVPAVNINRSSMEFGSVEASKPKRQRQPIRIGGGYFGPRNRWPQAKPKRKKNRLQISRRVRRRHRRAR